VDVPERMDLPDADPEEVVQSLRDLGWVNRRLGGARAVCVEVEALWRASGRPRAWRVLDVGTGGGDVAAAVSVWGARRGVRVWGVGLDRSRAALVWARGRGSPSQPAAFVCGDARALPFRAGSFDLVVSGTTFHHFSGADAERVLLEAVRAASSGVVVADLRRSRLGFWGAWALARTLWRRHAYARHDGPASVRRAYTVAEMRGWLARLGLEGRVRRRRWARWSLRIPLGAAARGVGGDGSGSRAGSGTGAASGRASGEGRAARSER
jgi:SAM-dependent methyltransferase